MDLRVSQNPIPLGGRGRSLPKMFVGVKSARASETSCRWPWLRLLPDAYYYKISSDRACTAHQCCMRLPRTDFALTTFEKLGFQSPWHRSYMLFQPRMFCFAGP